MLSFWLMKSDCSRFAPEFCMHWHLAIKFLLTNDVFGVDPAVRCDMHQSAGLPNRPLSAMTIHPNMKESPPKGGTMLMPGMSTKDKT